MKLDLSFLFNGIYKRYVELRRKYLQLKRDKTEIIVLGNFEKERPTQSDKPSPHSSFQLMDGEEVAVLHNQVCEEKIAYEEDSTWIVVDE